MLKANLSYIYINVAIYIALQFYIHIYINVTIYIYQCELDS